VVVNDLSTDGTRQIIDSIVQDDFRLVAVHKPINEGAAKARATGFAAATGELITFIDGDDVFLPNAIETLLGVYLETGADISMAGYLHCDEQLHPFPVQPFPIQSVDGIAQYSHDQMLELFLVAFPAWRHNNNPATAYCKLFRREVIGSIDWGVTDFRLSEDLVFSLVTFAAAQNAAVTNEIILKYRYHNQGKSRVENRVFQFDGKEISALEFCREFADLATRLLPKQFAPAIANRYLTMCSYYGAIDTGFVATLAVVCQEQNAIIAAQNQTIEKLQKQISDILNSRTWKAGQIATGPARTVRRIAGQPPR